MSSLYTMKSVEHKLGWWTATFLQGVKITHIDRSDLNDISRGGHVMVSHG